MIRHLVSLARWRRTMSQARSARYRPRMSGFWPLVARTYLRQPPAVSRGRFTAVLLVHRRPLNADLQARLALLSRTVDSVIVSNNNPDLDVHDVVRVRSPRLTLRNDYGRNQARRYAIAAAADAERFVLIDDDIFVSPSALGDLCDAFDTDRRSPAGVWGQRLTDAGWESGIDADGAEVDVLNRVYLCTREQAAQVFEVAALLGWSDDEVFSNPADDVLLSFTGERPARIIAADYIDCTSHSDRSISTFRQPGFHEMRDAWVRRLRELTGIQASDRAGGGRR